MLANNVDCSTAELFHEAWRKVCGRNGAAGVDGESVSRFEKYLYRNILEMARQFENDSYCLPPLDCVYIPKPHGGYRCIGIPTVTDRIVLHAVNTCLISLWDDFFSPTSFAYRPGRSRFDAVRAVANRIEKGNAWYVRGDVRGCFESLNWSLISEILRKAITDNSLRKFVNASFRVPFIYKGETFRRGKGIPMGSPLSPTLANVYLHQFDMEMSDRGYSIIRYGDDWLCLVESDVEARSVFRVATEIFSAIRIKLNFSKSRVGSLERDTISFLGFSVNSREIKTLPGKKMA